MICQGPGSQWVKFHLFKGAGQLFSTFHGSLHCEIFAICQVQLKDISFRWFPMGNLAAKRPNIDGFGLIWNLFSKSKGRFFSFLDYDSTWMPLFWCVFIIFLNGSVRMEIQSGSFSSSTLETGLEVLTSLANFLDDTLTYGWWYDYNWELYIYSL